MNEPLRAHEYEPPPEQPWDEPMFPQHVFQTQEALVAGYWEEVESTLAEKAEWVYQTNVNNGWFEAERSFGDDIALLHSEVSEMLEAFRDHGVEPVLNEDKALTHEDGSVLPKPEGVGSEAADVLVRLLDTCKRYDIDLEAEFNQKMRFNEARGWRHGGKRL